MGIPIFAEIGIRASGFVELGNVELFGRIRIARPRDVYVRDVIGHVRVARLCDVHVREIYIRIEVLASNKIRGTASGRGGTRPGIMSPRNQLDERTLASKRTE